MTLKLNDYVRHYSMAETLQQTRAKQVWRGSGFRPLVGIERKLFAALNCLEHSPYQAAQLANTNYALPYSELKPSEQFVKLYLAVRLDDRPVLHEALEHIATRNVDDKQHLEENYFSVHAAVDALILAEAGKLQLDEPLQNIEYEWFSELLGIYHPDWPSPVLDALAQSPNFAQCNDLFAQNQPLLSIHPALIDMAFAAAEQHDWLPDLEQLEGQHPELAFRLYRLSNGPKHCVINGLANVRTSDAAYRAWQLITNTELPILPAMQDTQTGNAIGDGKLYCHRTATALASKAWPSTIELSVAHELSRRVSQYDDGLLMVLARKFKAPVTCLPSKAWLWQRMAWIEACNLNGGA